MSNQQMRRLGSGPTMRAKLSDMISAALLFAASLLPTGFLLLARPPLLLPTMSLVALAISAIVALAAWCLSSDRQAAGLTLWDISGAHAFIGFAAGMLSKPQEVLEF